MKNTRANDVRPVFCMAIDEDLTILMIVEFWGVNQQITQTLRVNPKIQRASV
jgi:hypothetical protein